MANSISGEPYTKRSVPVIPTAPTFGGPFGWLSVELGNIQRGMTRALSRTVTASTTATVNDGLIVADATGGALTVTLPNPNQVHDMVVTIKRINGGGNTVTIGATVDGVVNPTLGSQWASKTVQAHVPSPGNGAWYTIATV